MASDCNLTKVNTGHSEERKPTLESYRFLVSGRVQGVGFRQATRRQAERLGLHGWVRNRDDGRVEGLVKGDATALASLHDWLHHGPAGALVDTLEWTVGAEEAHAGATGFAILR